MSKQRRDPDELRAALLKARCLLRFGVPDRDVDLADFVVSLPELGRLVQLLQVA